MIDATPEYDYIRQAYGSITIEDAGQDFWKVSVGRQAHTTFGTDFTARFCATQAHYPCWVKRTNSRRQKAYQFNNHLDMVHILIGQLRLESTSAIVHKLMKFTCPFRKRRDNKANITTTCTHAEYCQEDFCYIIEQC